MNKIASPMLNIIRSRSRRKSKLENFDDSPDSGLESGGSTNKYELEMYDQRSSGPRRPRRPGSLSSSFPS